MSPQILDCWVIVLEPGFSESGLYTTNTGITSESFKGTETQTPQLNFDMISKCFVCILKREKHCLKNFFIIHPIWCFPIFLYHKDNHLGAPYSYRVKNKQIFWKALKKVSVYLLLLICILPHKSPFITEPLVLRLHPLPMLQSVSAISPLPESKIRFWNLDSCALSSFPFLLLLFLCRSKNMCLKFWMWKCSLDHLLAWTPNSPQLFQLYTSPVGIAFPTMVLKETLKEKVRYSKQWKELPNTEQHLI